MTQHTDLIDRLRKQSAELADTGRTLDYSAGVAAANALEATAKNAFEAMPHDIPQRMKDAICEETGWSGSMVSRMYTELRKAFTGEPYKANEDLDAALLEIEALKAQESELCTLYGLAQAECKKLRAEVDGLRNDAALVAARERERCAKVCAQIPSTYHANDPLTCAAAIRALNTEGDEHDRP